MQGARIFSTLEIIFCAFLAENYFVKVLIPFIGVIVIFERRLKPEKITNFLSDYC